MYCPKCGKENDSDTLFCTACGEKIQDKTNLINTAAQKVVESTRPIVEKTAVYIKGKSGIMPKLSFKKIALAAIILLLMIVLCFVIFQKSDEEKIIELTNELAASMNESDVEKMIGCFEPAVQKQFNAILNTSGSLGFSGLGLSLNLKDMWTLGTGVMSGYHGEIYISIHDIEIDGDTATADISFSFDEGKKDSVGTVDLVKIKGKWYFKEF